MSCVKHLDLMERRYINPSRLDQIRLKQIMYRPKRICQDIYSLKEYHFKNDVNICGKWPCVSLLYTSAR